jgi:DNA invertase Pin-like site-specific DNA recombinase
MLNEKITPEHLSRKAIVYVRQSTQDQVRWNRESQKRQYGLAKRAEEMGWNNVEVIDEDLGRSGASATQRTGFQKLLASVCMREVGAVFSLEASRLARNNRDWYQLIDLCGVMNTLIIDFDGVYDAHLLNDRLLLGLKGTMSEFELALFRQRSVEALRQMAKRGELFSTVPIGFVRTSDNRCEKDPDLRIQNAIALIFNKFSELGSVRQVLLWFRSNKVQLPLIEYGLEGRMISWRLPIYNTVLRVLNNPIYAGAYVFGRTSTRLEIIDGQTARKQTQRKAQSDWEVLIRDHHEGYVSWNTYEANQKQIRENAGMKGAMVRGAVRKGQALLAGLLRCHRCGRKLRVSYVGEKGSIIRYSCLGASQTYGEAKCLSFGGYGIDLAIEEEILKVIQPAAIEAAMTAAGDRKQEHLDHEKALELALEQARYEAERAHRQYNTVEPENRLVAAELERRWDEALTKVAEREKELKQFQTREADVKPEDEIKLLGLAEDLPRVWNDPQTDIRLKKRIIRTMIREIVVDVGREENIVRLVIHWTGGYHSELQVKKRRTGNHRYTTDRKIVDLLQDLAKVSPDKDIARIFNRLGLKTGKANYWSQGRVTSFRQYHHIPAYSKELQQREGWLNLTQTADRLDVCTMSVHRMIKRGILRGKQFAPFAPWIIQVDEINNSEVQEVVRRIKAGRQIRLTANPGQTKLDFEYK